MKKQPHCTIQSLIIFAVFILFPFSGVTEQSRSNDGLTLNHRPIGKGGKGGMATGGKGGMATGGTAGKISGYIIDHPYYESTSSKYLQKSLEGLPDSFLEEIQPSILKGLIETVSAAGASEGGDLKQEIVDRYIDKIESFLNANRKITIKRKDKIYFSTPHKSFPVIAVTRDGGLTGLDHAHDLEVSLDGLKPNLSDFPVPVSQELFDLIKSERLDEAHVIALFDFVVKDYFGSFENYLKNKLSKVILHELTHEVIPNDLFKNSKNPNAEEEESVVALTEIIMKNKPLPNGLKWDYFRKEE